MSIVLAVFSLVIFCTCFSNIKSGSIASVLSAVLSSLCFIICICWASPSFMLRRFAKKFNAMIEDCKKSSEAWQKKKITKSLPPRGRWICRRQRRKEPARTLKFVKVLYERTLPQALCASSLSEGALQGTINISTTPHLVPRGLVPWRGLGQRPMKKKIFKP